MWCGPPSVVLICWLELRVSERVGGNRGSADGRAVAEVKRSECDSSVSRAEEAALADRCTRRSVWYGQQLAEQQQNNRSANWTKAFRATQQPASVSVSVDTADCTTQPQTQAIPSTDLSWREHTASSPFSCCVGHLSQGPLAVSPQPSRLDVWSVTGSCGAHCADGAEALLPTS